MLTLQPQTRINQYVILGQISSCSKNSVFKAYIPDGANVNEKTQCYIIKAIPFETEEEKDNYNNQAEILHLFHNITSIMQYNETFVMKNEITDGKQYLFAVMDFCQYIDLFDYYSEGDIPSDVIRSIAYQALTILKIIHSKRVIHHDIKPANFLVESISPLVLKITDFEFSVQLHENQTTNQPFGTPWYMAPELFNCLPHDMGIDIWALGITLYELVARKLPFNLNENQPQKFIIRIKVSKNHLIFDEELFKDPDLIDLISKMLEKDQSERITAEEALHHHYFDGFNPNIQSTKEMTRSISQIALEETDEKEKTDVIN
ncbi:Serine/threonine-protein kinase ulk3 [Tritrichomonas musculus]|uniref:Serine/threonine-protein kinase ulk3 n=1 Tax=Tritrichomonas musculus TaxID=1915356 RepID=A0ABR2HF81_9EUKA